MSRVHRLVIGISEVLAEVNRPNAVFDLKFRKTNGTVSVRTGCTRLQPTQANRLNERKKMNRSGILKCYQPTERKHFDCYIDLIVTFNRMPVNHLM
ncbi:hypothetical protein [Larkinella terrae]|uniref:Uncharacterized protein n=1 Tax=Larkinella terrae TaxID=2025311 RepID=A0A7K0EJ73_9BACT|nr:hypothetical protein [Larkinella terrae]MRS61889.1 hypothetical protein [Larkinella terrae]